MSVVKIIVLCGGEFAFPALQVLAFEKHLAGVAAGGAERQAGRFLRSMAGENQIPCRLFTSNKEMPELLTWLKKTDPSAVFSICFPYRIPVEVLQAFPGKFFNFHTGPLPQYRGPMPIFEVLRAGEKETALTVHRMDEKFDTGPVIFSETVPIVPGETFGSLAVKMSHTASLAARNMAQMLAFGSQVPVTGQHEQKACYYAFPAINETMIRWEFMFADEIIALINACNPWNTGADAVVGGKQIKVIAAEKNTEQHGRLPGTVLDSSDGRIHIACLGEERIIIRVVADDRGIRLCDN